MILMNSSRSCSSSVAVSRLENPTIAFNGVRISWLILARNADFSRSDSKAFSLAVINAFSCLLRSVINSSEPTKDTGHPCSSYWSTTALVSSQSINFRPSTSVMMRNSSWACCNSLDTRFACTCSMRSTSSGCIFRKYSEAFMMCAWGVDPSSLAKFIWASICSDSQVIISLFRSQRQGMIRATLKVISNFLLISRNAFSASLRAVMSTPKISMVYFSDDWQIMNS